VLPERGTRLPPMTQRGTRLPPMTRPSTRDLRALGRVAAERDGVYTGELDSRLRGHAEMAGRRIRDYRTERKAARPGLLTAGALGVTLGAVSAGMAIRKRVS
jgi:hypothetical protein